MGGMNINIIVAPVVGATIGYITNAVAIKMLFRPTRPLYIGKFRVPLTPGLIPKEKARLSESIGGVVSRELLSEEALRAALLSDAMREKLREALGEALARGAACEDTLMTCLERMMGEEPAGQATHDVRTFISTYLAEQLIQADLGSTAASSISDGIKQKTPGGIADFLSKVLDGKLKQNATQQIRVAVNGYVERHALDVVGGAVDREAEKLFAMRVCDLAQQHEDKLPELIDKLESLYEKILNDGLHRLLAAIDLGAIVRNQIESIDDRDLEHLIFQVVDKELKAIVYLGALLGFFMGFVNILFL